MFDVGDQSLAPSSLVGIWYTWWQQSSFLPSREGTTMISDYRVPVHCHDSSLCCDYKCKWICILYSGKYFLQTVSEIWGWMHSAVESIFYSKLWGWGLAWLSCANLVQVEWGEVCKMLVHIRFLCVEWFYLHCVTCPTWWWLVCKSKEYLSLETERRWLPALSTICQWSSWYNIPCDTTISAAQLCSTFSVTRQFIWLMTRECWWIAASGLTTPGNLEFEIAPENNGNVEFNWCSRKFL